MRLKFGIHTHIKVPNIYPMQKIDLEKNFFNPYMPTIGRYMHCLRYASLYGRVRAYTATIELNFFVLSSEGSPNIKPSTYCGISISKYGPIFHHWLILCTTLYARTRHLGG